MQKMCHFDYLQINLKNNSDGSQNSERLSEYEYYKSLYFQMQLVVKSPLTIMAPENGTA